MVQAPYAQLSPERGQPMIERGPLAHLYNYDGEPAARDHYRDYRASCGVAELHECQLVAQGPLAGQTNG